MILPEKKKYKNHTVLTLSILISVLVPALFLLTGCTRNIEPISRTGFYFDTVIQITLYDTEDESIMDGCFALADDYEHLFSATLEGSDVWNINHGNGEPVTVSHETASLLETALDYATITEGIVDPTIRPLSELWNFNTDGDTHIPEETAIADALSHVSYKNVSLGDALYSETGAVIYNTVTLNDPEAAIDLGFIAKGYIADKMKEYLLLQGVGSACISLGGNVIVIGEKPDKSPFRIGIQEPFAPQGTAIATVEVRDCSVVTSGIYERYFYEGDTLYHHVLDTATGYPVDNGLSGVTILCESSVKADALSTACLCLGLSKGRQFLDKYADVEYLMINKDGTVYYSEHFPLKQEDLTYSPK